MSLTLLLTDSALKATLLLFAAAVAVLALRRSSAAVRHLTWSLAVVGSLALPALTVVVPAWRTPLLTGIWPADPGATPPAEAGDPTGADLGEELDRSGAGLDTAGESLDRTGDRIDAGEAPDMEALVGNVDEAGRELLAVPATDLPGGGSNSATEASEANANGVGKGSWIFTAELTVLAWVAGVALVLVLLLGERLRIWRLAARARPVRDERLLRRCRELGRRLGLERVPRLLVAEGPIMPMTWGFWRPALLLPADAVDWSDERVNAVLIHEMAHVRRADYATQAAAGIACALYWFNPLAWVAARRLRVEREHACDDEVLRAGSAPSGYAGELLEMARSLRCHPSTELAAMSMARPSQLSGRLLAVLDEDRSRRPVSRPVAASGGLLLLALLVPLAALRPAALRATTPAGPPQPSVSEVVPDLDVPQEPSCWDPRAPHRSRVHRNDPGGGADLLWYNDECRVEVQIRGELEFADGFTRIAGISGDGFLRILERVDGVTRELEVRPSDAGPAFSWRVDGDLRDFEPEGRAWLGDRLISLIRRAGLAVEERVAWILEREGVDGVLEEVRIVSGDGLESEYLLELIDRRRLQGGELEEALNLAVDELGSDSGMARFLSGVAERLGAAAVRLERFWGAASTIGSDSEHSRFLLGLLEIVPASEEVISRVLTSAERDIGSDSEMADLLTRLAGAHPNAAVGPGADAFWSAAATVGSDSEHRAMLLELVRTGGADSSLPRRALRSASSYIGSDSDMSRFLATFGERYPDLITGELRADFVAATATVGSDSDHAELLLRLTRADPSVRLLEVALTSATANIGSDSSMGRLLVSLAERHPSLMRGELREAYLSAAATVGSDSEHRRVIAALEDGVY